MTNLRNVVGDVMTVGDDDVHLSNRVTGHVGYLASRLRNNFWASTRYLCHGFCRLLLRHFIRVGYKARSSITRRTFSDIKNNRFKLCTRNNKTLVRPSIAGTAPGIGAGAPHSFHASFIMLLVNTLSLPALQKRSQPFLQLWLTRRTIAAQATVLRVIQRIGCDSRLDLLPEVLNFDCFAFSNTAW
jgi:hypothetical protein